MMTNVFKIAQPPELSPPEAEPSRESTISMMESKLRAGNPSNLSGGETVFEATISSSEAELIFEYLNDKNPRQRINQLRVNQYASDQANGHWKNNYDPMLFTGDWWLVSAQHRLIAQIKSGVSLRYLCVAFAPENVEADTGAARDPLVTHGLDSVEHAVARTCILLRTARNTPTRSELAEFLSHCREQLTEIRLQLRGNRDTALSCVATAFLLASVNSSETERARILAFARALSSMDTPVPMVRPALQLLQTVRGKATSSYERADVAVKLLFAIKLHLAGEVRQILRPTMDGLKYFEPNARFRICDGA